MKLLVYLCIVFSISFVHASNLELRFDNNKLEAHVSTVYTNELKLVVEDVFEVDRTQFEQADIDYDATNFQTELSSDGVTIHNSASGFSSSNDVYTYDPTNVNGAFSNGNALTATISRDTGEDATFIVGTLSAEENDVTVTLDTGSFVLQKGFQKLDFITEWSTTQTDANAIIVQCSINWDIDESAVAKDFLSNNGDSPDFDVQTLKNENGKAVGVEISIEDALFSVRFPDELAPVGYSDTTGSAESPSTGPLTDVSISLQYKSGRVEKDIKGSAMLYFILKADNTTTSAPTVVPQRIEIDPVVEAESSASVLSSWFSVFM